MDRQFSNYGTKKPAPKWGRFDPFLGEAISRFP